MQLAITEGVDEELGLVERRRLERAHDDERGAGVGEHTLHGARTLDEPVVHRLEEDEELGDVLEELRAEDAVCELVEGP